MSTAPCLLPLGPGAARDSYPPYKVSAPVSLSNSFSMQAARGIYLKCKLDPGVPFFQILERFLYASRIRCKLQPQPANSPSQPQLGPQYRIISAEPLYEPVPFFHRIHSPSKSEDSLNSTTNTGHHGSQLLSPLTSLSGETWSRTGPPLGKQDTARA